MAATLFARFRITDAEQAKIEAAAKAAGAKDQSAWLRSVVLPACEPGAALVTSTPPVVASLAVESEQLYSRAIGLLDRADAAVAAVTAGVEAAKGKDARDNAVLYAGLVKTIAAVAPVIGKAREALELVGKARGELGDPDAAAFQSKAVRDYVDMVTGHTCDVLAEYLGPAIVAAAREELARRLDAQRESAVAVDAAGPRQLRA